MSTKQISTPDFTWMGELLDGHRAYPGIRTRVLAALEKEPKLELIKQLTNILWQRESAELADMILESLSRKEIVDLAKSFGVAHGE